MPLSLLADAFLSAHPRFDFRYTGHIHGLCEVRNRLLPFVPRPASHTQISQTFKKTPIPSQIEVHNPTPDSFVHTRTEKAYKSTYASEIRDPCNNESSYKKHEDQYNHWPMLQTQATQDSFKPPTSNIALGDNRLNPFITSYKQDFSPPLPGHGVIRSPNRNNDLAKSTTSGLLGTYRSAYNRVGAKRLQKMISTMKERMDAKIGNSNDNAFRIRKLFMAWDENKTGLVHYEDMRQVCESFGMQLDDDSLLALYCVNDPTGSGYLSYMDLVKQLMHPDSFSYYVGSVDNSQGAADAHRLRLLLNDITRKIKPVVSELQPVLKAFDAEGKGFLTIHEVQAACASLGVVVSESEFETLKSTLKINEEGLIDYVDMCSIFA